MPDYVTPPEHRLDLHFPRSRFSSKLEDMLLLLSSKMVELGNLPKDKFADKMDEYLSSLRGHGAKRKTLANLRTEMIRLYGLAIYEDDTVIVGNRTLTLVQNQDVPRFFKSICNKFQFPNGINKIHTTEQYVVEQVQFKPAQYLIKLLRAGSKKTEKAFAVTAKEAAYLVFNDKRVTVGHEDAEVRADRFLDLRAQGILCDNTGDIIRYARDFLNYMVWANLLIEYDKKYFLNEKEKRALDFIEADDEFFPDFDIARQGNIVERDELKEAETGWLQYYADADFVEEEALKTTLAAFSRSAVEITTEENQTETVPSTPGITESILEFVEEQKAEGQTTKDIGDEGEAIVYGIEKERVTKERPELIGLVRIVSNDTSLGFDIQSVFADGLKKYIEVKTTKRNFAPDFNTTCFFDISYNAWATAQQFGDHYFIARVIIAREKLSIFVIQNPYKQLEEGQLSVFPIEYRLVFKEGAGEYIVKDQINI